jgi:hypothetical protein
MLIQVHEHTGGTGLLINTDFIVAVLPETEGSTVQVSEAVAPQRGKTIHVSEGLSAILEAVKFAARPG